MQQEAEGAAEEAEAEGAAEAGAEGAAEAAPTGSKNKPLTTALALEPVRVVIVISTFPDIAQVRYLPLVKLDTVCVFSIALVLASLSVTVSDRPLPS